MSINLPTTDLTGAALREAAAGDFRDIATLVRQAITAAQGDSRRYLYLEFLSAKKAVIKTDAGRYYQYNYVLNKDNIVEISDKIEVNKNFKPVSKKSPLRESAALPGTFIEALDNSGSKYRIRVINAGLSKNNTYYPASVLRESVPLLEGVRVFVKSDQAHVNGHGKSFENLIGKLTNPVFVEAKDSINAGIEADFHVLESAGDTPAKLKEAVEKNMTDIFGFSIDADGTLKKQSARQKYREAEKIKKYNSVDLIIEPGAGGQVIKLLEAVREDNTDMSLKAKMIEAIKKANKNQLPEGLDIEDADQLDAAYREALAPQQNDIGAGSSGAPESAPPTAVTQAQLDEHARMIEARADMREQIAKSDLPDAAKTKLTNQFREAASFNANDVAAAIKTERDYLAQFTESGKPQGDDEFDALDNSFRESEPTNAMRMLDAFFDPDDKTVRSFRECYQSITGDTRMSGHIRDADPAKLREAIGNTHGAQFREAIDSGTWGLVLGDAITRAMQKSYEQQNQYDIWRNLADAVPVGDFRTQERTQYGGYGDIPAVAERGTYDPLSTPGDEVAKYAITKRGGTESVSMEAMRNDDVGAIRRIPMKLSQAAKRTLAKFVLDFIKNNPVINLDNKALFHVDHGNLGTAALDKPSLRAGRLAMLAQQEPGSNDPLGIPPANLWVPHDLEELANDLFVRQYETDKTFLMRTNLNVIPVWYWTDANDWAMTASINDIPLIEIGFLDGNEEPELFIQDSPTSGSMWTNDTLTYKLRHIYGGNVMDYRGFYKSVVA